MTVDARLAPVGFAEIEAEVRGHLAGLPAAIDSFIEEHILASAHHRITIDGEAAGYASIHEGSLITQFALAAPFRRFGQPSFGLVRRLESVQAAFVPTCDELYLAHALDDHRQLATQAYLFAIADDAPGPAMAGACSLRLATPADADVVRRESGDFLPEIERHVGAGELFMTERDGDAVGFGLLVRSRIYPDVASVGMYAFERHRREGVGTETVALLIAECRRRGLRPVAGCWRYNHASKQTLERAGMHTGTRLLRIDY